MSRRCGMRHWLVSVSEDAAWAIGMPGSPSSHMLSTQVPFAPLTCCCFRCRGSLLKHAAIHSRAHAAPSSLRTGPLRNRRGAVLLRSVKPRCAAAARCRRLLAPLALPDKQALAARGASTWGQSAAYSKPHAWWWSTAHDWRQICVQERRSQVGVAGQGQVTAGFSLVLCLAASSLQVPQLLSWREAAPACWATCIISSLCCRSPAPLCLGTAAPSRTCKHNSCFEQAVTSYCVPTS